VIATATNTVVTTITVGTAPFAFGLFIQPFIAFSAFAPDLTVYPVQSEFSIKANFTLGAGSNAINPPTEQVTLKIGSSTITIPIGSFVNVPFGGIGDFAARIRKRLAVLDGDQLGEPLGVARDQIVRLAQDLGAIARLLRGPALEGCARGIDRRLGVVDRGARDRSDLVLGRRIKDIEAAAVGSLAPFAADPKIGRDIGQQIFVHVYGSCDYAFIDRCTRSTMRSTVGSAMSSNMSAAGSGM
jgi:hypothetical protein